MAYPTDPTDTPEPPPIRPVPSRYGTAVTGEERFGRPALEAEFDAAMTQGNGARLLGLRRIGKSTEALACIERLAARPGLHLVSLDAQGITSEAKLLLDILAALPSQGLRERVTRLIGAENAIAHGVREALQKFTGMPADIEAYFVPIALAAERAFEAQDGLVLVIDEFPWLCRSILESDPAKGRSRVDVLLATLRRWRAKGVRMMLLGSIGMAALGRQHGLDLNHLNDLQMLEVPPLTPDEAADLVAALVQGEHVSGWSDDHTRQLLDECLALYPAIVQKAFQQLSLGHRAVPLAQLPDIFADKVRPDLETAFFAQFDRRLKAYRSLPAPMPALLERLLKQVLGHAIRQALHTPSHETAHAVEYPALQAAEATHHTDPADLGDALAILREDGFLSLRAPRRAPQAWRPASSLVLAWWEQRRGGGR